MSGLPSPGPELSPADEAESALLELLVAEPSAAAIEVVRRGVRRWVANEGAVPLERCLGLTTRQQRRRRQRDYLLQQALQLTPGRSEYARCVALSELLHRMAKDGRWRRWRSAAGVPASADALDQLVFQILGLGRDPSVSAPLAPSTIFAAAQKKGADPERGAREHADDHFPEDH